MSKIRTVSETEQPKVGDFIVATDWLYRTARSNPIGYGEVIKVYGYHKNEGIRVVFAHSPERFLAIMKYRKCPKLERQSAEAVMGIASNYEEWASLFSNKMANYTINYWREEGRISDRVWKELVERNLV